MSQQEMSFDEINRDGPASYSAGYEENPHYNDYSSRSFGQKLSGQEAGKVATSAQRLVLAVVSLVLWVLVFVMIIGTEFATRGNVTAAFFLFFGLLLFTLLIAVINVVFNRRR